MWKIGESQGCLLGGASQMSEMRLGSFAERITPRSVNMGAINNNKLIIII